MFPGHLTAVSDGPVKRVKRFHKVFRTVQCKGYVKRLEYVIQGVTVVQAQNSFQQQLPHG